MPPTSRMMVAFLKRKEGLSLEQFYRHWETVHGPLVKPWAERFGMTYKQIRIGHETPTGVGAEVLAQYDGCAIFEFADAAVVETAWKDAYFLREVNPDQALFMQEEMTIMTVGETVTVVYVA